MRPSLALSLSIALVLVVSGLLVAGCGGNEASDDEREKAIAAAEQVYGQAEAAGTDLASGPCISESLPGLEDWVADVAHDPREDVDDDPANQCQRYRNGEADHFVELTPDGELIRAE